ncbi:MAG: hypothetical protein G01um101420_458 [Parcubacteria group bacterium Gr01-1014_20]|nr:MAG: hypothetical protein G01um101420_458 [Parcubacteria group bacterium Gr01-1014_20]
MEKETFGFLSGAIVVASIVPYAVRAYQGKVKPNPMTWLLWTMIGFSLLVTYRDSGAEANIWPAVFGFTNPFLIVVFLIKNRSQWKKFEKFEYFCLFFGLVSLAMWIYMREERAFVQYALFMAIVADAFAAIPTIVFVWRFPAEERPFAWGMYAVGYGLGVFAISEHTASNYILPIYMFFGALSIALPQVIYRLRKRSPLTEWI